MTAKTKTIFRSKSAQAYIFIQLCQEMYEFDEDGERYYEKAVHGESCLPTIADCQGFLPELFHRWSESQSTHVVTIILFSRIYYNEDDVQFLHSRSLTEGLRQDHLGKWHKDFFKVVFDFESRKDWTEALPEIKLQLMKSEEEMLQTVNVSENKDGEEQRILGKWSFVSFPQRRMRYADEPKRRTRGISWRPSTWRSILSTSITSTVICRGQVCP
jgi:hypothetical protein